MRTLVLLLALFAAFSAKAQNATCPQPVTCDSNPCNGTRCLRFLNSECRVDACRGECRATFFRSNGREVTSRCAAPTCAQTRCPARRTCVNRVVPPTCPRNRPNCRQYISPQCVLPPPSQPPTNCAVILCPTDRPVCEVRQTRQGPRARCVPRPPPTNCENVECDEGMECRVRERAGLDPVVRCKPIRVVPTPRDCSELECSDGFVCMVTNGTAICVEPPPLPDACEGLNCEEQNLECRTFTFLNITRAICGPISDCNRLMCNESEGLECRVSGEGLSRFAFCARTANCSRIRCDESQGLECRVRGEGQFQFAICARTDNCSRIRCNESQGLECRVVGEGDFSAAVCLLTRNCSILNPVCRRSGLVCEEPQSERDFDSASCVVPTSCEDLQCNPGMVCREFAFNDRDVSGSGGGSGSGLSTLSPGTLMPTITTSAPTASVSTSSPVTPTSPTLRTVARCVPGLFQTSCNDLECEEDQVCFLQIFPSRNISLASCFSQNLVPVAMPQSCNNTGLETCSLSGQLCVDLVQGSDQVTFSCVQANCMEGDSEGSGTMCTTPDSSCVSVPGSLSGTAPLGIDSVCIQNVLQFEFGTVCGDRTDTCPEGLACQEIQLEGEVVGTICNRPATVVTSCDNIECADEQECLQFRAEGTSFVALCLLSASLDTVFEAVLPQLPFGSP